jgi:hypothetical protein
MLGLIARDEWFPSVTERSLRFFLQSDTHGGETARLCTHPARCRPSWHPPDPTAAPRPHPVSLPVISRPKPPRTARNHLKRQNASTACRFRALTEPLARPLYIITPDLTAQLTLVTRIEPLQLASAAS